jgi:hypothetical protein
MSSDGSSKTSRRRFLYMFGIGAGALAAADTLFAQQFAREATSVKLPAMVYDANLQMMVDPETGQPLYARAEMLAEWESDDKNKGENKDKKNKSAGQSKDKEKPKPLPTVTAGCSNCPKRDD